MSIQSTKSFNKIALVATPWPLYSRPSIQLGTLKAYLRSRFSDLVVETHHFYLKLAEAIGYRLYHDISERTWLAEAVYAGLLFPNRTQQVEKLFLREAAKKKRLGTAELEDLTARVKQTTDGFIDAIDWQGLVLVGFSVSLCQLTAAFYFIKAIKQKHPKLVTVIGGSAFCADSARVLLKLFPELDVVVIGEGELPLSRLVRHLKRSKSLAGLPQFEGVFARHSSEISSNRSRFSQMETLHALPSPDHDEYFNLLNSFEPSASFIPTLPVEISRGCWWKRAVGAGKTSGCAFCNLNLQWSGYRSKQPAQVVSEIDALTTRYKTLSVAMVDNVLPRKESTPIFEQLGELKKDFRLFSEIRASTPLSELKIMRTAGLQEVQIGIEALSTSLLKKLRKGTTAIRNLEIMKNCEALGIENLSNLIIHFPGSDQQDVFETLGNLDFAISYRPLKIVAFWLGIGSPVWMNPKAYGIRAVFNHPNWRYLFPAHICRNLQFTIQAYRADQQYQKKIWQPVKKKVRTWHKIYRQLHREPAKSPILGFRDGGDFLIIHQRRFMAEALTHRLTGASRSIYLYCRRHRSIKNIRAHFSSFAEDKLVAFLKMMVAKKLMFEESDKYLSLAVPFKPDN